LIQKQTQGGARQHGIFLGGLYIALSFRHISCFFFSRGFPGRGMQDITGIDSCIIVGC
jgi:hypothetical protein